MVIGFLPNGKIYHSDKKAHPAQFDSQNSHRKQGSGSPPLEGDKPPIDALGSVQSTT